MNAETSAANVSCVRDESTRGGTAKCFHSLIYIYCRVLSRLGCVVFFLRTAQEVKSTAVSVHLKMALSVRRTESKICGADSGRGMTEGTSVG